MDSNNVDLDRDNLIKIHKYNDCHDEKAEHTVVYRSISLETIEIKIQKTPCNDQCGRYAALVTSIRVGCFVRDRLFGKYRKRPRTHGRRWHIERLRP